MTTLHGNGHVPDVSALREQLELARMQVELRSLQEQLGQGSLRENEAGLGYGGWGSIVDPYEQFRGFDRGDWWLPSGNSRDNRKDGANRPFVWTDFDLDLSRSMARWLASKNGHAGGALETLADYTIRTGFVNESKPAAKYTKDGRAKVLASLVEDVISEFSDLNNWPMRQWLACFCAHRDGEKFIRAFAQNDGTTLIRDVWPEQVRQPLGSPPDWSYGVHTAHGDAENPIAYAVEYGDPDDWQEVPAADLSHLKLNVDSCVKRGLSDLFPVGEQLDGIKKLIRNLTEGGAVQAAIAWIEEFAGGSQASIAGNVANARDKNRPYPTMPITGKEVNYQKFEPGTIVKTGAGRKYLPAPTAGNTSQHIAIVEAALQAVASRWKMPEFMISSNAANNNFASVLVAGSPFVTRTECRQALWYKPYFLRILWTAVRNASAARRFIIGGHVYTWEEISRLVDINVTPPSVAIANKMEAASIDNMQLQAGVLSIQTARAHAGLDNDQEDANLATKPLTRVAGKVTDVDPEGNPQKPEDDEGGGQGAEGAVPSQWGGQQESRSQPEPISPSVPAVPPMTPVAPVASTPAPPPEPPPEHLPLSSLSPDLAAHYAALREQYGDGLTAEIERAAMRLVEGVPNKTGPGCHDPRTGHPASCGNGGREATIPSAVEIAVRGGFMGEKETNRLLEEFFPTADGRSVLASVAGAPSGATVTVDSLYGKQLKLTITHPAIEKMVLTVQKDEAGNLYIDMQDLHLVPTVRGSGLGTDIFARLTEQSAQSGIAYISCHAAKNSLEKGKVYNGYYTWPRLGFDQSIAQMEENTGWGNNRKLRDASFRVAQMVREKFPQAKTILDVVSTQEGRDWWKANGTDLFAARFDLSSGSRSSQLFGDYLKERAKVSA